MILLRLAEDVISMDGNLQSNRKKEITQELNVHAQGLFTFFIETLKTNMAKYRTLKVCSIGITLVYLIIEARSTTVPYNGVLFSFFYPLAIIRIILFS